MKGCNVLAALMALPLLAACGMAQADSHIADQSRDTYSNELVRFSDECEDWDEWDKPAKPFHIYGNTYYVGTCGISAILVTGAEQHILIDTGTEKGSEAVLANIETLGFSTWDVGFILHSHEHFDHIGGLWMVSNRTEADIVSSYPAESVISTGEADPDDPQFGMHEPMHPASVQSRVATGDTVVTLHDGQIENTLTAIETPGHTPGALTWQWQSCQNDICKTIVYADSLSSVSSDEYRFSDHPAYVAEYRAGLQRVRDLKCDILLTPHPSASKMIERAATGTLEGGYSCAEYADAVEARLDARLAKEAEQ